MNICFLNDDEMKCIYECIEDRRCEVERILNILNSDDDYLRGMYNKKLEGLNETKKNISGLFLNSFDIYEVLSTALELYIRDTKKKLNFTIENFGEINNGMAKHFSSVLNIAEKLKEEIKG